LSSNEKKRSYDWWFGSIDRSIDRRCCLVAWLLDIDAQQNEEEEKNSNYFIIFFLTISFIFIKTWTIIHQCVVLEMQLLQRARRYKEVVDNYYDFCFIYTLR
jgi:hypothetical protein